MRSSEGKDLWEEGMGEITVIFRKGAISGMGGKGGP